ncbi:MAG TPA: hypothetical protein VFO77_00930 [Actinoplanes sp.]|nr:hypothetical protein [Actinoplanes sp.]
MTVTVARPVPATTPAYAARQVPHRPPLPVGAVAALLGVVALNLLVLSGEAAAARSLVGLPVVLLVPGALTLAALGGPARRGADRILHTVALSVAVLIVLGLVLALLPGAALTTRASLVAFDVAVVALGAVAGRRRLGAVAGRRRLGAVAGPRRRRDRPAQPRPDTAPTGTRLPLLTSVAIAARVVLPGYLDAYGLRRFDIGLTAAMVGLSAGVNAVALAVYGARQLNAGGGAGPAVAALAVGTVAFLGAVVAARAHRTGAAAVVVYLLGAAVLLATSLRGAGVTGHDIKIEYRVLMDTVTAGSWSPGGPYPGYNSCLSLTVLPALLAKLLGLSALDVLRVVFQLVFAVVPVGVLLIARRLLTPGYAVLSAGLFIAFPTFVNDLPMLNRQEIALLFFTVGLLSLLDTGPRRQRAVLFAVAAVGLTVSHYTSAAVAAGLLTGAWVVRGVRLALARRFAGLGRHRLPALWPAALAMIVLVVGWAALAGSATAFAVDLAATARAAFGGAPVLSDSVRYSPVSGGASLSDDALLTRWSEQLAEQRSDDGVRPAPAPYQVVVLAPDELPETAVGRAVARTRVSPEALNSGVRKGFVVLFQVGAVVGCALLWWMSRRRPAVVLAELGTAGLGLLGASLVVPQVTDSYGLLRMFQQLLPVLGIAVVVAVLAGGRLVALHAPGRLRRAPRSTVFTFTAVVVVTAVVALSGLLPRLTGGYAPQLSLANAGSYHRAYLATADDLALAAWIRVNLPKDTLLVADSRDTANLRALTPLNPHEGVLPGSIPDDAYLLLQVGGTEAVATAVIGDRVIRYAVPADRLTAGRSVVHTHGSHRLYAPYGR